MKAKIYNGIGYKLSLYGKDDVADMEFKGRLMSKTQPIRKDDTFEILEKIRHYLYYGPDRIPVPIREFSAQKKLKSIIDLKEGFFSDIPVITTQIFVDTLPPGYDLYIVTEEYLKACQRKGINTSNLITPGLAIYDSEENPVMVGVLNFIRH